MDALFRAVDGQPTHPTTSVLIYGTSQKPILGVLEDGSYRRPVQVSKDVEPGACCYCGGMTITGIYVREDESELECHGRHDDQASRRHGRGSELDGEPMPRLVRPRGGTPLPT